MAVKDRASLNTQADVIKNETIKDANTTDRVGQMFKDLADSQWNLESDTNPTEAIVSKQGNNSTGVVGGLPFSTPTAAAEALRAYVGTQRLMTIKAGTYVAEDCLFADGIISCEPGVILQTGDNNAMFENVDGSYDMITFSILGGSILEKTGSKEIFNITTNLFSLNINAETISAGTLSNKIISIILNIKAKSFALTDIRTNLANINIESSLSNINITAIDFFIQSAKVFVHIDRNRQNVTEIHNESANGFITYDVWERLESNTMKVSGVGIFNINYNYISSTTSIEIGITGDTGTYNFSGSYNTNDLAGNPLIKIIDASNGSFNFKGKYTHENNGKIIDSGTAQTVDVSGSLTMITTASPKVGANITINDIQDY